MDANRNCLNVKWMSVASDLNSMVLPALWLRALVVVTYIGINMAFAVLPPIRCRRQRRSFEPYDCGRGQYRRGVGSSAIWQRVARAQANIVFPSSRGNISYLGSLLRFPAYFNHLYVTAGSGGRYVFLPVHVSSCRGDDGDGGLHGKLG